MKNNRILLIILLLLLAACRPSQKSTTIGPLTLSPGEPRQGETITLQYRSDSGTLAGNDEINATFYYVVKDKIYAEEVALSDSGNSRMGSFSLPDSALAFALKFTAEEETDNNNGVGYIFPVYSSGKPLAGALAAESGFYNGLGSNLLGIKANADTALQLLRRDMADHPDIKTDWQATYLRTLLAVKKDSAYPEIRTELKKMLSGDSLTEENYMMAVSMYRRMKMMPVADSLTEVVKQKFPRGTLVRNERLVTISRKRNADSMMKYYKIFKTEFPGEVTKTKESVNIISVPLESSILYRIAEAYADRKQYDKYMQLARMSNDSLALQGKYNGMAWKLGQAGVDLPFADSISKASLDILQALIDHPEFKKPGEYTVSEWKKFLERAYGQNADTYAMILAKEGKYKDALTYQRLAVDDLNGKSSDVNERYSEYLIRNSDYATAQSAIEKFYENGNATAKMTDYLKTAYVKQKGSDAGYADYLSGLEARADEKIKEKLKKSIVDKPANGFVLPDLEGKNISLAALKGKVVVVDFWATWCGPCKASFPGMQKAVTHFKGDTNVVFLFVDTWENTKPEVRHKEVADFIKQNNYSFHVLMDQHKAKDSTQFQVVSDYGVEGIPTKFIIDPDGRIRFKLLGFDGNTDNEVKKIKMMIGMLKS